MESNSFFKPDIYPVIYWGIAYGVIAGIALFILFLLSSFITLVWFPVFLAGLVYGGYRNYQKQKAAWYANAGTPAPTQTPMEEFKEAVSDVYQASQEMAANEAGVIVEQDQQTTESEASVEQPVEEQPIQTPPTPPAPPAPPIS